MRVLIACEESQEVCKAFRKLGHEAYSCDVLPCSGGHSEWHFQEECQSIIKNMKWDLMIAHPPCTRLCNSGLRWLEEKDLWVDMMQAARFFKFLLNPISLPLNLFNPVISIVFPILKCYCFCIPIFKIKSHSS